MRTLVKDTKERILPKQSHTCRICGSSGHFQTYLVPEMMLDEPDDFEYFICDHCGCMQISDIPSDLGKYYSDQYYSYTDHSSQISFDAPVNSNEKILDVGCGSGSWLLDMANLGYGNLFGCDPFIENDISYGDRIFIQKADIHAIDGAHTFDRIHMKDSFEHVPDPLAVLQSAARLLKPTGTLDMSIPFFPNIAFDMFGPHWYQLDAPRHIVLHTTQSLRILAESAGLAIQEIKYDSAIGSIITSFFYQHGIRYNEITPDLVSEYFTPDQLNSIRQTVNAANQSSRGDHATIILTPVF